MRRFVLVAVAALALAPSALAATKGPVFGLRAVGNNARGYFVYSLAPGASQSGAVIVSNAGTAAGTVKLFTADATTGRTSGTVYETDKKTSRVGTWVKLSVSSLHLAPGQHKTVSFTVHVPAGQKPGQWVGGIVAETSHRTAGSSTKQKANVQIRIRDLTIVAVQANVPGPPLVSFRIGKVTTGGQRGFQQIFVHLTSAGNTLVKPTGAVSILDKNGKVVETLPFTLDTFLPQTAIDYPILLKKALAAGDYSARVSLNVNGKRFNANPSFSVSKQDVAQVFTSASPTQAPPVGSTAGSTSSKPWALIGAAVAGVLVVLLLLLWLLRRRRKPKHAERLRTALDSSPSARVAAATEPPPLPKPQTSEPPSMPEAPPPAAAEPARSAAACEPFHYWDVAYDRGQLGDDGVWRFPHRCRTCGVELLAADIAAASAQANQVPR